MIVCQSSRQVPTLVGMLLLLLSTVVAFAGLTGIGVATVAAANAPAIGAMPITYAYDAGPPQDPQPSASHDWSLPGGSTFLAHAYDALTNSAQQIRHTESPERATDPSIPRPEVSDVAQPVSFSGSVIGAETGPLAIEGSSRVAPWAGNTLSRVTQSGENLYRVWGGESGQAGEWLTPIRPGSSAAAREGLALPEGNSASFVSDVNVPAGTRIQVGTAGSAFGQSGGWPQVQLLERIPLQSFGKGVPLQ